MLKFCSIYKPGLVLLLVLLLAATGVSAQVGLPGLGRQLPTLGRSGGGGQGDSLQRRDENADSITIVFNYLDSARSSRFDSSIGDYYDRFPIPYTYHYLGNPGTAAHSILFRPEGHPGWDPGFHAYDVYRFTIDKTRFFNTTRPYTELGYTLGSQAQQIIDAIHTQNFKPTWNASIQYHLITSPGYFTNQRAAHNSYRLTSWYQGRKRRYNNYLILLGNKQESAENGGILNDTNYLKITDRLFTIPVKIGNNVEFTTNPFGNSGETMFVGTRYDDFNTLLRQQYDLGRKDSIVTDSTVIPLFYPRVRFEHTFLYSKNEFEFRDEDRADFPFYEAYYDFDSTKRFDTLVLRDRWKQLSNDVSIYTFPDAKNLQQFLKLGVQYQWLSGTLKNGTESFYNLVAHGEYRNRTRNQKWDMEALGQLWWVGHNAGDYHAYVSLQRLLSTKLGSLQVGFENSNRSPSFAYDKRSSFYLSEDFPSFNKENRTHLFGRVVNPALKLQLGADYYLISNYLYIKDFYQPAQYSSLFNVLMLHAAKTIRLKRNLNWYFEASLQQKAGNAPLNIPLIFTRNRLAFEGHFYRNLHLSTGFELRYHTPYRMDQYSPAIGRFVWQDSVRIENRPDLSAFLHFRIRSFKALARLENLNVINFDSGNFALNRHNFAAPDYPYPRLVLRLSIYWSFVN